MAHGRQMQLPRTQECILAWHKEDGSCMSQECNSAWHQDDLDDKNMPPHDTRGNATQNNAEWFLTLGTQCQGEESRSTWQECDSLCHGVECNSVWQTVTPYGTGPKNATLHDVLEKEATLHDILEKEATPHNKKRCNSKWHQIVTPQDILKKTKTCLLYTSDAADD